MATCLFCHPGVLRIIAAVTQGEVLKNIFRIVAWELPVYNRPGHPAFRASGLCDPLRVVAGSR
jgi:hypothetical protein